MKKIPLILLLVVIVITAVVLYVVNANETPSNTEEAQTNTAAPLNMGPQMPPELTVTQTAQLALGVAEHESTSLTFDVNAGMFYYVPNIIRVKKGDTVTINMINDGGYHDFTQADYGVKIEALKETGETGSVTFLVDKVGSFEYYCSVGQHRQMGQTGVLIVEE